MEKVKKVLMYVFFPITIILIGLRFFMEFNKGKADESLKKADETDRSLEKEEDKLKFQAEAAEKEADRLGKEAKEANDDTDWHKKV